MLKHMFAPPGGASKGKGRRRKGDVDDAPDLNGLAGNEGAGGLAGRELAEGKNRVRGKQAGKKKNVQTGKKGEKKNAFDSAGGGPMSEFGLITLSVAFTYFFGSLTIICLCPRES